MKILFVLGFPNPFPGAGWTRIEFFTKAWSKKGHEVEVLGTFTYTTLYKRGIKKIGRINIFNFIFNMNLSHPLAFAINSLISFAVSTLFLFTRRPNITIVSVPAGDVGLGALMACKLLKAKFVIDYRDEWEDYAISLAKSKVAKDFYFKIKKFATYLYAKSGLVVAVTPSTLKVLKKRGLKNLKLITNGADTKTFTPLNIREKEKPFTIFYSGGVGNYYRLDVVVKALDVLVDKGLNDIRLVIAGAGEIQNLLKLAKEKALSDQLKYVGSINEKTELAKHISMADVGIIPYDDNPLWKNSVPAKFYEYCACGIPVIATVYEDSLLATLIKEYEIGVTSPPMDEEKLAEAIYRIYRDKSFREVAGKRARAFIEEKFDRNKIAEEFLELIKNV